MCHPEERGRRAEGSFFVRNIWEALYLKRCLRCRHDKQFNVFMSKHLHHWIFEVFTKGIPGVCNPGFPGLMELIPLVPSRAY